MPSINMQNKTEIPSDCVRLKLPPKFTLLVHKEKIYGLYTMNSSIGDLPFYPTGSKTFNEIFNEYMPAWAAYYPDDFKNIFIKSNAIDYSIDKVAMEGLKLIVKERESFEINDPPHDIMSWVYDTIAENS